MKCFLVKIGSIKEHNFRNIYLLSHSVLALSLPKRRKSFISKKNLTLEKTSEFWSGNGDCNVISAQKGQSYLPLLCSPHINYIGAGLYIKFNRDQKTLPDILEKNA